MSEKTVRIVIISSCGECPYHSVEESKKKEYSYCWTMLKTINDLDIIHEECPLEEAEIEEEE
jgi:hypothetical protein